MAIHRDTLDTPITIPFPGREVRDDPTSEVDTPRSAGRGRTAGALEPCLVILAGLDMGRVIPIPAGGLVVGRERGLGLVLSDDAVSKRHLDVALEGTERLVVRDLGSTNGTYLGGRRVETATLAEGEKLFLGRDTVLKFALHDRLELEYQRELYESSVRDGLTGAYNRRYFAEKIGADLSFGRRHGLPLSLLMFDIDHFKRVNDTFGHEAGDEALRAVCTAMAGTIRNEDVLARFGGEEFVIIAAGTGLEGGRALGERIRRNVGAVRIRAGGRGEIGLTVSAGVASLRPGGSADAGSLIAAADGNLYAAKSAGRDRVMASEVG